MFALSRVSFFKTPFSLSVVIPKASFLRDLTNDQNLHLLIFSWAVGIRVFRLKVEDIRNMFPICISNDLLNMCSEPFVVALNVRVA